MRKAPSEGYEVLQDLERGNTYVLFSSLDQWKVQFLSHFLELLYCLKGEIRDLFCAIQQSSMQIKNQGPEITEVLLWVS